MKYTFYDTCSLLLKASHLWEENEHIAVSSITLSELEHIKTAANKDAETKFAARKIIHELDNHPEEYHVVVYTESIGNLLTAWSLEMTNDAKIIACALELSKHADVEFVTNDLCCKTLARMVLPSVSSYDNGSYDYDGYKEVYLTSDEMAEFYSNPDFNRFNLLVNEYVLIYDDTTQECVDKFCWTGETHRKVPFNTFNSDWFGEVKPIKGDIYQTLLADSLVRNKITMVKGPAGSGKSYMSLGFLMSRLEHGKIDKIIIFCNTVAAKNAAKLGLTFG